MTAVAIIPARYASTRFPGKPLAKATGKYLIQHVYERVMQARRISRTIIATDDDRIATAVREFGGEVAMTRDDHPSGTDRVAEVAAGLDAEIIVNVQGDEPEIEPAAIDLLVEKIESSPEAAMATLACPFPDDALVSDSSAVKVVVDTHGMALYFSRSVIPYPRDAGGAVKSPSDWLLHLGIYAYRRAFLLKLASLPPSRLEQVEKLEQLRALENGYRIVVGLVQRASVGIDTPTDYQAFVYRVSTDRNQGVAR